MKTRKELKHEGRTDLKKHYFIFVAACLIAAFLSAEFRGSLFSFRARGNEQTVAADTGVKTEVGGTLWKNVLTAMVEENLQAGEEVAQQSQQQAIEQAESGNPAFGRSRGVLSSVVNWITSGSILVTIVAAVASVTGSESAGLAFLILLFAAGMAAFGVFVQNTFPVAMRRVFLEGMNYDRVTPQRFSFLLRVGRWARAAWIMLVRYLLYTLWCLTIAGAAVKRYSYYLVPYIVAENPDLTARQAITLSRRMMKGHKWQCFVFELSFLGWELLGLLTFGLVSVLYVNPYKTAVFTRYYAGLRAEAIAKGIPGAALLQDPYLYERAPDALIRERYADVIRTMKNAQQDGERLGGWRGFLADNLGLLLLRRSEEKKLEQQRADSVRLHALMDDVQGIAYPVRLYPIPETERRRLIASLNYMRRYSVWSLIAIFLSISVFGWLWEVGLHLVSYGTLVNRGALHGPWLPIYGTGAVLMLTMLYRCRRSPALQFVLTVLLCGALEYTTSLVMQFVSGGARWWDYSGYFLNLHGRICAEGLLVFGVGGLAIVYLVAPLIDALVGRLAENRVRAVCAVLFAVFLCDAVYTQFYPNTGAGITETGTTVSLSVQLPDAEAER
ncbi:MAG TPA: DUF975 family protein [Candidatus Pygmaiobacter gallistercoris]|nr:DUF975 family protein [Candidatus Pygmaiobacter gallistercoris]